VSSVSNVPSSPSSVPAAPIMLRLSAGTAHICEMTERADDAAPSDGFESSANEPKTTYVPVNFPARGGRVPVVSGLFGRKPEPLTVMTVSAVGSRFVILPTTSTLGVAAGASSDPSSFDPSSSEPSSVFSTALTLTVLEADATNADASSGANSAVNE